VIRNVTNPSLLLSLYHVATRRSAIFTKRVGRPYCLAVVSHVLIASVGHLYRTRRSAILPRPSQTRGQVKITLAARINITYQRNNMQHLPRIYRLANRPDPTYEAWVTNSWCISSVYFEHREDLSIACRACYLNLLPCDQELYRGVSRHYLNFGSLDRVEECATCNTRIGVARPLNSCEICPLIQARFLTYLHEEGESPWEDPEPTIVGINTIRL